MEKSKATDDSMYQNLILTLALIPLLFAACCPRTTHFLEIESQDRAGYFFTSGYYAVRYEEVPDTVAGDLSSLKVYVADNAGRRRINFRIACIAASGDTVLNSYADTAGTVINVESGRYKLVACRGRNYYCMEYELSVYKRERINIRFFLPEGGAR